MTAVRLRIAFSEGELASIRSAAYAVFNEIAYDLFGEGMPKSMPRSHVIEVVLDASRLTEYLNRSRRPNDKTLATRFDALDYETQIALVKPAFPERRYGL